MQNWSCTTLFTMVLKWSWPLFISQLSSETLQQTCLSVVSSLILLGFQGEEPAQTSKCTKGFSSEVQRQLPFPYCPPSSLLHFYWFWRGFLSPWIFMRFTIDEGNQNMQQLRGIIGVKRFLEKAKMQMLSFLFFSFLFLQQPDKPQNARKVVRQQANQNLESQNHRIDQIGKDLKDHWVRPQHNHTTLTLTTLL